MNTLIAALNECSAAWFEMIVPACWSGGTLILMVWILCRAWRAMPPSARPWLWRLAVGKLLLTLCWQGAVGLPILPPSSPSLKQAVRVSVGPAQGGPAIDRGPGQDPGDAPMLSTTPPHWAEFPTTDRHAMPPSERAAVPKGLDPIGNEAATTRQVVSPMGPPIRPTVITGLFLLWLLGVAGLSWKIQEVWCAARRLCRAGQPLSDPALTAYVTELCQRLQWRHAPPVLLCDEVPGALLVGLQRPAILLPGAWEQHYSLPEMRLMVAHELAHLKRRDLRWNWLLLVAQTLFFFHPLLWLARREWHLAEEVACDDLAVRLARVPLATYSAMLMKVALPGRARVQDDLLAVGVVNRYRTLHSRLSAMQYFDALAGRKLKLAWVALLLLGTIALVPWRVTARPAPPSSPDLSATRPPLTLSAASSGTTHSQAVAGEVLRPDGRPAAGAIVVINIDVTNDRLLMKYTDAQGRFAFQIPPPANKWPFECWAKIHTPGFALAQTHLKQGQYASIRLERGTRIAGAVTDRAGRPMAGVPVQLEAARSQDFFEYMGLPGIRVWVPEALESRFTVRTGSDGRYILPDVPLLDIATLQVADPRFVRRRFEVRLGPGVASAPTQQVRPASVISGRVVLAASSPTGRRPLGGIRVSAGGNGFGPGEVGWSQAVTANDGTYRVASLPPGTFRVMAHDREDRWVASPLKGLRTKPAATIHAPDLVLSRGAIVQGTVVDEDSGAPVGGALVSSSGESSFSSMTTDRHGRYRVRVVPGKSGVYVSAVPRGYLHPVWGGAGRPARVKVKAGETKTVILRLKKGLTLQAKVLDVEERPAAGAVLTLLYMGTAPANKRSAHMPSDGREVLGLVDEAGQWSVYGLTPGWWRLVPRGEWQLVAPQEVLVPARRPVPPLQVTLRRMKPPLPDRLLDSLTQSASDARLSRTKKSHLPAANGADAWHRLAQGKLAVVQVERALYEHGNNFLVQVRVTNVSGHSSGIDLRDLGQVVRPRAFFDGYMAPLEPTGTKPAASSLDAGSKKVLLTSFRAGRLVSVPAGGALSYFWLPQRSLEHGSKRMRKGNSAPYLLIEMQGALPVTDGQAVEVLSHEVATVSASGQQVTNCMIFIPTPVTWKRLPAGARVLKDKSTGAATKPLLSLLPAGEATVTGHMRYEDAGLARVMVEVEATGEPEDTMRHRLNWKNPLLRRLKKIVHT